MFLTSIVFLRLISFFSLPAVGMPKIKLLLRVLTDVLIFLYLLLVAIKPSLKKTIEINIEKSIIVALYILFLGLATLSLLYSSSFEKSLMQLTMYIESFLFSFLLVFTIHKTSLQKFITSLTISVDIINLLFFIASLYFPIFVFRFTQSDQTYRLGGFIINPNELGLLLVIGILMHFLVLDKTKNMLTFIYHTLLTLILIYNLYQTHSRSAFIALFATIIILAFLSRRRFLYLTTISIIMFAFLPIIINKIFLRGGKKEEFITMTGRIPFWKDLITDVFPKRFFCGFGFQRIYYTDIYTSIHSYPGEMAHNTFIQSFLGLGLPGGIVTIILTILTFISLIRRKGNIETKKIMLALYIPTVINSFTEFGIFGFYNFDVLIFQILILYLMMERKFKR